MVVAGIGREAARLAAALARRDRLDGVTRHLGRVARRRRLVLGRRRACGSSRRTDRHGSPSTRTVEHAGRALRAIDAARDDVARRRIGLSLECQAGEVDAGRDDAEGLAVPGRAARADRTGARERRRAGPHQDARSRDGRVVLRRAHDRAHRGRRGRGDPRHRPSGPRLRVDARREGTRRDPRERRRGRPATARKGRRRISRMRPAIELPSCARTRSSSTRAASCVWSHDAPTAWSVAWLSDGDSRSSRRPGSSGSIRRPARSPCAVAAGASVCLRSRCRRPHRSSRRVRVTSRAPRS